MSEKEYMRLFRQQRFVKLIEALFKEKQPGDCIRFAIEYRMCVIPYSIYMDSITSKEQILSYILFVNSIIQKYVKKHGISEKDVEYRKKELNKQLEDILQEEEYLGNCPYQKRDGLYTLYLGW